ncbi:large subunit ribosomal protein L3e [Angomonas deanei]|nr:large subunit ribosomal protein L3e [Angomonas deanei]|eukprot:EPY41595.1 large subunit ribosomal protein L3e [Angomonas deanei]
MTREGCHAPMQATLRRPRWVVAGRQATPHALHDTLGTVTLGHSAHVARLGLLEHGVHAHLLLKKRLGEGDLGGDVTTVHLDLLDVGLLHSNAVVAKLAELGVGDHADDGGLLGESGVGAGLSNLALLGTGELLLLGESQLGGLLPVLVVAAAELGADVGGPTRCRWS